MSRTSFLIATGLSTLLAPALLRAEPVHATNLPPGLALPHAIVPNVGQFDARARFVAKDGGMAAFFTDEGWRMSFAPRDGVGANLFFTFEGADRTARTEGVDAVDGTFNWFIGSDPSAWRSDVPGYRGLRWHDVYPGVDVHAWTENGALEYDFECARASDVASIVVRLDGADHIDVADDGSLSIATKQGVLRQDAPRVFSLDENGARTPIACRLVARGANRFGFDVGSVDGDARILVDPAIQYSTYLGGASGDEVHGIAVNSSGHAFVVGTTSSAAFPTTAGAFDTTLGFTDAFLVRLSAPGNSAFVATFLGGGGSVDAAADVALDSTGQIVVVGNSQATIFGADFPTTPGAFDTVHSGGSNTDGFVTKFNSTGSALVFSTFLGESLTEVKAVAVRLGDNTAYVTGTTSTPAFPVTAGAFDTTFGGGVFAFDAFVTHLNNTGTALVYSGFIGASSSEVGNDIAVDSAGNAYVCGLTLAPGFGGTAGVIDTTPSGAFVVGINPAGSSVSFATGLGAADEATGIALSGSDLVVTGWTQNGLLTSATAYDSSFNGGSTDAFVVKIDNAATTLKYGTYLGGSSDDRGFDVTVDARGNAIVMGGTTSANFPVTPGGPQQTLSGPSDAFFAKLDPKGEVLMESSFLGGSGDEAPAAPGGLATAPSGVATDSSEAAYIAGFTSSANFPTTAGAFDVSANGSSDGFVTKAATRTCAGDASASNYGVGKPGAAGIPLLTSVNPPYIGATTSVRITNAKPFASSILFLGVAPLALPFDGGTLLVNPALVINLPPFDAAGTLTLTATIADDPSFCGVAIYHQVIFQDPAAVGFYHTAQTNGLVRTLGS